MTLNLLDEIGNWNPQLFREIKGRLNRGNMAIVSALSLSAQLLLLMYFSAMWWLGIFTFLSIFSVLALLVAGTYLLVSDLENEERRGTLNFIRLSPQSAKTIFLGKVIGVPILLYLVIMLVVPLHLYAGLAAQIPLNEILCFYIAVAASCALFYSSAMLFGLTTSWLGGFQPWLASATVSVVFWISTLSCTQTAWDLVKFLSQIGRASCRERV